MKFKKNIGILSYGAYLPRFVLPAKEIGKEAIADSLGVSQKTVADVDEDTTTLATAAAQQALVRLSHQEKIGCLFIGSESHVYAVKPTGTVVAQALSLSKEIALADLQFACKAGTQAVQIGLAYVQSGMANQALAIGADTAQSRPGDALEYTAASAAAAFVLGKGTKKVPLIARVVASVSLATDTPDFWRRPHQSYPEHGGRFTGEPAYFAHVMEATQQLLSASKLSPTAIDHCVFHTPNVKFPQKVAKKLGFTKKQLAAGLIVSEIGNTYAAASLLGLAATLDQAKKGQKILVTSYGSGAGADSFLLEVTAQLPKLRRAWRNFLTDQLARCKPVNYRAYREMMELKE
jgi:hydroxymethylglutaryl-CoA synthase